MQANEEFIITAGELESVTIQYACIRNNHVKKKYGFQLSVLRSSFIHRLEVGWLGILSHAGSFLSDVVNDKYEFDTPNDKRLCISAILALINISFIRVKKMYE